jgi:hypothetical protein
MHHGHTKEKKMKRRRSLNLYPALVIMAFLGALGCGLLPTSGGEPEIEFTSSEDQIEPGECAVLKWEVQGAEGYPVFLDGEVVDASAAEMVCPEETTRYKLVVGAPGGPYEERVTISVVDGPRPAPTTPPSAPTAAPPPTAAPQPPPTTPVPPTATPQPPAAAPTSAPIVNQTTHGRITWDEIWTGEIRIIGDIIVEEGATLTIEPGTIVRIAANEDVENLSDWPFDMQQGINPHDTYEGGVHFGEPYRDEGHHISIFVLGTLHAVGTPERMITITSDSPTPGIYDWNHLQIAHGILSYSVVEYYRTMGPGDGTVISHSILRHVGECAVCANSSVLIEHNTISYAGHELIDMHQSSPVIRNNHLGPNPGHAAITIDGGSPQIVSNVIEGCGEGIHFISPPGNPHIEGNAFSNNGEDVRSDY